MRRAVLRNTLVCGLMLAALWGASGAYVPAAAEHAAKPAPPPIAYYPGAFVEVEVSLNQADLLPLAHQYVVRVLQPSPQDKQSIDDQMDKALGGVKKAFMLQMGVQGPVDPAQIVGFYTRIPKWLKMTMVFNHSDPAGGRFLLWAGRQGDGLFGLRMTPPKKKNGQWQVQAVRMAGPIDVRSLLQIEPVRRLMQTKLGIDADAYLKGASGDNAPEGGNPASN